MAPSTDPPGDPVARPPATSERLSEADYQSNPVDYLIYCCHLATYDFAIPFVQDRTVLDFGCGTGYGTHRLAAVCRHITGVDISAEAVEFAARAHQADNLEYQQIRPLPEHSAPFADASFDAITSFQVIEHIWEVDAYVDELARLLKPGGVAVIATPDRSTRLFRGQRPWNLYHVIEYDHAGLRAALERRFPDVELYSMTAPGIDDVELARDRRLRLATYPVTFPGAPEWLRSRGLRALKRVQARARRGPDAEVRTFDFGVEDVRIEPGVRPSMNLVAVARR
jgi:SAM-dependent methyltransferase